MKSKKIRTIIEIVIVMLICFSEQSLAQTTTFEMIEPEMKIQNSRFDKLSFIDSRADTISLGNVQKGFLNQRTAVIAKRPLEDQIKDTFVKLTDASAQKGTLVFQLRQLNFAELTTATKETGYCTFRARLYQFNGDMYEELMSIDTVVSANAMDVTHRLYKKGSKLISGFIADNLSATPVNGTKFTYNEVLHIDSIERSKMKLFAATTYTDGLYKNYSSFNQQTPDYKNVIVEVKDKEITTLKINDEYGKPIVPEEAYALVYEGKPYILTAEGNYLLRKEGTDFCFTGLYKSGTKTGAVLATAALFGAAGVLFSHDFKSTNYYDIKLDYLNGSFIPYRQLSKNELKLKRKSGQIPSRVFKDDSY